MALFDDNPPNPPDPNPPEEDPSLPSTAEPPPSETHPATLPGDPIAHAAGVPPPAYQPQQALPEDLRIPWSWVHLIVFLVFALLSQVVVGLGVVSYFSITHHFTSAQQKQFMESDPRFLVTSTILWAAVILLFLYVTIGVLRDLPFWSSIGWKKFRTGANQVTGKPWMYFLAGCGLSICVALASSKVKDVERAPIQEFLKNRNSAVLLMSMAVLIAPVFEETLFRGYLYPVLARIFSASARNVGIESSSAIRAGIAGSILITGALFGLMHAPQLGWTWDLVGLLTLVGVIFTFARAWTGTVLASFLLHLGYNSMIALAAVIQTHGFTNFPAQ